MAKKPIGERVKVTRIEVAEYLPPSSSFGKNPMNEDNPKWRM